MENLKKLKNNKLYLLKKNTPIGSINKRDLLRDWTSCSVKFEFTSVFPPPKDNKC